MRIFVQKMTFAKISRIPYGHKNHYRNPAFAFHKAFFTLYPPVTTPLGVYNRP